MRSTDTIMDAKTPALEKDKLASDADTVLGSGFWGKVYDRGSHVVKEINLSKASEAKLTESDLILSLQREADLNKLVHGLGALVINKEEKKAFLEMKKLPLSLAHYIDGGGDGLKFFGIQEAFLTLFLEILAAINSLHKTYKVVHNDLYAKNILVDEKTGTVALCDFGNANRINEVVCLPAVADHHAPELKLPARANPNQDVYSLGFFLLAIIDYYSYKSLQLKSLAHMMMNSTPDERPSLDTAIEIAKNILIGYESSTKEKSSDSSIYQYGFAIFEPPSFPYIEIKEDKKTTGPCCVIL